jgi:hypothetical protein
MKTEKVGIATIKPYWRNPRKNEDSVEAVAQSIKDYGYNQPITVDKDYTVITGHTRLKALYKLGWTEVPVVVLDLPPEKAKEYRLADNKTSELADWDFPELVEELRELTNPDEFQIYFPDIDLTSLLKDSTGESFKPVSADKISGVQDAADSRFKDHNERELKEYVEIICPHCEEEFFVYRSEVLRDTVADDE